LTPRSEHILPCSTSATTYRGLPPFVEKDQGLIMNKPEDERPKHFLPSKSTVLVSKHPTSTKRRSPDETLFACLRMTKPTHGPYCEQELTRKLVEKFTYFILRRPSVWFSLRNVSQSSQILSGTTSCRKVVNLDVFSPACTHGHRQQGHQKHRRS